MPDVAIIDSGGANIASVQYALGRLGATSALTTDRDTIVAASRVLLPGVGAARDAMQRLQKAELTEVIPALRQPVLGICLGMQLLCAGSDEGDTTCLGVFEGQARRLAGSPNLPVPNMGWCLTDIGTDHPALQNIASGSYFYFVHSYAIPVSADTVATARHAENFSAVIARDNFVAAQFHPERSSAAGAQLLRNFLEAGT